MNCETLQEYLDRYGPLVADRARQAFEPLHVPATDAVVTLDLKRPMLPPRPTSSRRRSRPCSGRRPCSCAASAARGKARWGPARSMPMRPGNPIGPSSCARRTWSRPGGPSCGRFSSEGTVEVHVLEKWREMLSYPRGKPAKPTWLIMGETIAKNGPYWRAAAVKDSRGVLRCPDCGAQLRGKANGEGNFLSMKDLERSRKRCTAEVVVDYDKDGNPVTRPCGAALWQYVGKPAVWAPADYIHKHMKGVFDYLICDEVHEEKSDTSARANALGALVASCRKVVAMTGTLIGGKAGHVRSLLFRLSPKSLKAENLSWEDDMEFARRYGRVDTIVTEKTGRRTTTAAATARARSKRQAEQPGIMPTLYGRHLIGNTIFLSLKDVAADLPEYDEHPTPVRMSPELGRAVPGDGRKTQGGRGQTPAAGQPSTPLGDAPCTAGVSRLSLRLEADRLRR